MLSYAVVICTIIGFSDFLQIKFWDHMAQIDPPAVVVETSLPVEDSGFGKVDEVGSLTGWNLAVSYAFWMYDSAENCLQNLGPIINGAHISLLSAYLYW